jgi:hypothetical protein
MYHKQLVTHINTKRSSGLSDEDIRKELLADGWSNEDIDLGFHYVLFPDELNHFSLSRLLKSEVKASVFVTVLSTVIVTLAILFIFFRTEITNYTLVAPVAPAPEKIVFSYGVQPSLSNPDFFNKVKQQFIDEQATFIEVDLSKMITRVYRAGILVVEVPVKTKGKEGSWWETPAGLYKIETKERTHYSTMGQVTQPWSMQFQGNFFIHGWPYHDDGTPVATSFSGGCVRLADEDAKKVFDAVTIGTPILVYEKDFILDTFTYTESKPTLGAANYLSADMRNNFVFLEQNESIQIPLGGLTKLMTALVATEYINIEKSVSVTRESLVPTQKPRLHPGMNTTIYQLLFPLLRESSNEAAEAIANSYGRASFINHMNAKAKSIGMTHTIFADPSGVSEANLSTLEDIFMMSKYIYNNRSFIFNITSGTVKTNTYGKSIFQDLGNANSLVERDYFFGGVEGSLGTSTGYNLAVFEVPVIGSGSSTRPLFFLSMNSGTPRTDVIGGLLYVLNKFK